MGPGTAARLPLVFVLTAGTVYAAALAVAAALPRVDAAAVVAAALTADLAVGVPLLYWLLLVRGRGWPQLSVVPVFLASLGYSMILYVLSGALGAPPATTDPLGAVLPSAVYDAVLGVIIGPLTIALHDRRLEQERVDW